MKEHWLMRSYGKRRWTISGHDSVEEATEAAKAHVALQGHLYPDGTRLYVESNVHIGFVYEGGVVQKFRTSGDVGFTVEKIITGHPDHKITLP